MGLLLSIGPNAVAPSRKPSGRLLIREARWDSDPGAVAQPIGARLRAASG